MVVDFKKANSEPEIRWEIYVMSSIEKARCDITRRGEDAYYVQLALKTIDLLPYLTPEIQSEIFKYHAQHKNEWQPR